MDVGYQLVRASRHIGDDPRADRKSAGLRSRAARPPGIRAAAVRALWPSGLLAVSGPNRVRKRPITSFRLSNLQGRGADWRANKQTRRQPRATRSSVIFAALKKER